MLYQQKANPARALLAGRGGRSCDLREIHWDAARPVMALVALVFINPRCPRHVALFFGACLLVVAVTNWQAIVQASQLQLGLGREVELFQEKKTSLPNQEIMGMEGKDFRRARLAGRPRLAGCSVLSPETECGRVADFCDHLWICADPDFFQSYGQPLPAAA